MARIRPVAPLSIRSQPALPYSSLGTRGYIVHIKTEAHETITIGFTLPFSIDPEDEDKVARLNRLFWSGVKSKTRRCPLALRASVAGLESAGASAE